MAMFKFANCWFTRGDSEIFRMMGSNLLILSQSQPEMGVIAVDLCILEARSVDPAAQLSDAANRTSQVKKTNREFACHFSLLRWWKLVVSLLRAENWWKSYAFNPWFRCEHCFAQKSHLRNWTAQPPNAGYVFWLMVCFCLHGFPSSANNLPTDFHIFQRGWNHQPILRCLLYTLYDTPFEHDCQGQWCP